LIDRRAAWRSLAVAALLFAGAPSTVLHAQTAGEAPGRQTPQPGKEMTRALGVTVPENNSATVRMMSLSKGTRLAFAMQSREPLWVVFLDEDNFKRYPNGSTALLTARLAPGLSFGLQVPEAGNYYLVLDNREQATPNKVQMELRATLPPGAKPAREPKPLLQQY
jgi:hypothetical protein